MGSPLISLDKRIATALTETEHEAADLQALVTEVEETVGSVTAEMTYSSAQMLDPMNSDFSTSRERVEKAKIMLARFNISLPKLKELHAQAVARAKLAVWNTDLAKLVAVRNEVSARFRDRYCAIGEELVSLFDEIVATDKLIDNLHDRAHAAGAQQRMRKTEAHARGVEQIDGGTTKSILEETKLPSFGLGSGTVPAAWPRPKEPWNLELMRAMQRLFTGPPMDPVLVAEANAEVEAKGESCTFNEAYIRALQRRKQAEAEAWAERGRERERQREAAAAEERDRLREAAVERRRQGM
jgi:hypothetical protein